MANKLYKENSRPVLRGLGVGVLTFFFTLVFYLTSNLLTKQADIIVSAIIILLIVIVGVVFDMIGIAVTAASEQPFHAMSAKKITGSRQTIKLIRNADRVSNFCNDVVGDICGTVSGAIGAAMVLRLGYNHSTVEFTLNVIIICLIAALTVGGKSYGKYRAIKDANQIIFSVGKFISYVEDKLKIECLNSTGRKKRK